MSVFDRLRAKRALSEDHIREPGARGKAGERYSLTMSDIWLMVLGLICDTLCNGKRLVPVGEKTRWMQA